MVGFVNLFFYAYVDFLGFYIHFYPGLGNNQQGSDTLKDVDSIHISATFKDIGGERSFTELYLQAYYSPTDHFIKVSTSTTDARVS